MPPADVASRRKRPGTSHLVRPWITCTRSGLRPFVADDIVSVQGSRVQLVRRVQRKFTLIRSPEASRQAGKGDAIFCLRYAIDLAILTRRMSSALNDRPRSVTRRRRCDPQLCEARRAVKSLCKTFNRDALKNLAESDPDVFTTTFLIPEMQKLKVERAQRQKNLRWQHRMLRDDSIGCYKRECWTCGRPFYCTRPHGRYCRRRCRDRGYARHKKWMRKSERFKRCVWCDTVFVAKRCDAVFCTALCRVKHHRAVPPQEGKDVPTLQD